MSKSKKQTERVQQFHHLGSPNYSFETAYCKDNMEYGIIFTANLSNTSFIGEHIQPGDGLYLGLSEEDFESLLEGMIDAVSERLKDKLDRYNEYKKLYYTQELQGTDEEFEISRWNVFSEINKIK